MLNVELRLTTIMNTMETIDLFGNRVLVLRPTGKKKPKRLFDDYEGFVDKFKPKLTTDDCYTPPDVYDCVLKYVSDNFDLGNRVVVRPFFPGGDYETADYPDGCVVVDNPPFSILSKIVRFYKKKGIHFFLFAPHLTLFSSCDASCTAVVCYGDVVYENGAAVKTSFLSNLFGDLCVLSAPELNESLRKLSSPKACLPKYRYPPNVLTVSMVAKMAENGIPFRLEHSQVFRVEGLDCQKRYGKAIFGKGLLLSESAAAAAAAAAEAARATGLDTDIIEWELSSREWDIVRSLK
jgi:hypothetical protein